MFSGIDKLFYLGITIVLLGLFFVSGFFTDLLDGIIYLKTLFGSFIAFFGTEFTLIISLIAVIFVVAIVLMFRHK